MTPHSVHMTAAEGVVGRRALLSEVLAAGVVVAAAAPVSAKVKKATSGAWAAHEVCIALTLSLSHTHTLSLSRSLTLSLSLSLFLSLTLSFFPSLCHIKFHAAGRRARDSYSAHAYTHTYTSTHTHTHTLSHSLSHILSPSLSHTHTHMQIYATGSCARGSESALHHCQSFAGDL